MFNTVPVQVTSLEVAVDFFDQVPHFTPVGSIRVAPSRIKGLTVFRTAAQRRLCRELFLFGVYF